MFLDLFCGVICCAFHVALRMVSEEDFVAPLINVLLPSPTGCPENTLCSLKQNS